MKMSQVWRLFIAAIMCVQFYSYGDVTVTLTDTESEFQIFNASISVRTADGTAWYLNSANESPSGYTDANGQVTLAVDDGDSVTFEVKTVRVGETTTRRFWTKPANAFTGPGIFTFEIPNGIQPTIYLDGAPSSGDHVIAAISDGSAWYANSWGTNPDFYSDANGEGYLNVDDGDTICFEVTHNTNSGIDMKYLSDPVTAPNDTVTFTIPSEMTVTVLNNGVPLTGIEVQARTADNSAWYVTNRGSQARGFADTNGVVYVNVAHGDQLVWYILYNGITYISPVVTAPNDLVWDIANLAPTASNQSVTTDEDTAVNITLVATDPNGDDLTWPIVSQPAHGTLTGTAPNLTYTPAADYNGTDSFTFRVFDDTWYSNTATVNITVNATSDAPVADSLILSTNENTAVNMTLTASDPDGDTLTWHQVTSPSNGTLSGTLPNLTYTPADGFYGTDTFTFKVNDGTSDSNIATVTITVLEEGEGLRIKNNSDEVLMQVNTNGHILMGTTVDDIENLLQVNGSMKANGVITLMDSALSTTYPANSCQIFAQDESGTTEVKVQDGAGNITTVSPHNFSISPKSEPMAWSYYSENRNMGQKINVDMLKVVRLVEDMSGEKLVYTSGINGKTAKEVKGSADTQGLKDIITRQQKMIERLEARIKALEEKNGNR